MQEKPKQPVPTPGSVVCDCSKVCDACKGSSKAEDE